MAELFHELGFTVGVEIGVREGLYSEVLCQKNPELKLFSIDPWEAYEGYRNFDKPEIMKNYYAEAKARLAKYTCVLVKKMSLDAVKDFEDHSLDFVYIDGNHNFQNCTNDICEWTQKVKYGGIISGHDYIQHTRPNEMHVVQVVNAYTNAYDINPWFLLGSKDKVEGQVRDKDRSFMWVNEPLLGIGRN
jgi:hypothetical protein